MYKIEDVKNKILVGNALDELHKLPDNSIDCLVTSPPYYTLHAYGSPPQIWCINKEQEACAHEWQTTHAKMHAGRGNSTKTGYVHLKETIPDTPIQHDTCSKCGAWRGELGQEPTPDLFLDHLLLIFAEVKRVLKQTGTCWVNLGDTYAGTGNKSPSQHLGKHDRSRNQQTFRPPKGLRAPHKSLLNIPSKFATRMVEDLGFILRNEIIWHKPNVMPQSAKDRFTIDFEKIFFFVKSQKYYFETQYEPLSEATLKEIAYHNKRAYTGENTKDYDSTGAQKPSDAKKSILRRFAPQSSQDAKSSEAKILKKFAPIGGHKQSADCDKCEGKGVIAKLHDIGFVDERCNDCNGTGKVNTNKTYSGDEYKPNTQLGRLKRTVWRVSTKPFRGAHFAVYPKDLIRPMLQAGCPHRICAKCGTASKTKYSEKRIDSRPGANVGNAKFGTDLDPNKGLHNSALSHKRQKIIRVPISVETCDCGVGSVPGIVLDPFIGAGTTRLVAQELGLDYIGIEIKPEYADMATKREYRLLQTKSRIYGEIL